MTEQKADVPQDFAIWTPKFDGDAPPNWKAGMAWDIEPYTCFRPTREGPHWAVGIEYKVPAEALAADAIDTPFDVEAYLATGRANRDKLPSGVAEALGPERDWANDVWQEAFDAWGMISRDNDGAAAVLRSRCRPIGNDTVTDELISELFSALQTAEGYVSDTARGVNLCHCDKLAKEDLPKIHAAIEKAKLALNAPQPGQSQ